MFTSDVTPWPIDPRSGNMPYPSSRRLPIDIGEDTIDVGGGDDDDEEEY